MCWELSSSAKIHIAAAHDKFDVLRTAEDTSCTFSSLPGTAMVHEVKFKPGTTTSTLLNAWSIECFAKVTYAGTTWHSGGIKEVDVFAGLKFQRPENISSLCSSALGGDWQNAKVLNGNEVKQTTLNGVPLTIGTEYRCGNFGWVGCKFGNWQKVCKHHFSEFNGLGFDEMDKRRLNFLERLSAEPEHEGSLAMNDVECPALHDNAQMTCSIDAFGQVRPGSSQDAVNKAVTELLEAIVFCECIMRYCLFCAVISFCFSVLSLSLFLFNRNAFGRGTGAGQLAQPFL